MKKIWCWIVGHKVELVQRFSGHAERVRCIYCCGDFAVNHDVRLMIPWDEEVQELYESFGIKIRDKVFRA